MMRIAILGTGLLAAALGGRWACAGHTVSVAGRSLPKAQTLAEHLGDNARATSLREAVVGADAALLAVAWSGVEEVLNEVEAAAGSLAGVTLIDPTNAMTHGVGVLSTPAGSSGAQHVASLAPDSHVVKAFHLFPSTQWSNPDGDPVTVTIAGDHPDALRITEVLARDAGAETVVLGGLDRSRQLEEAAGFVIGLTFQGVDPRSAVPGAPTHAS